MVVAGSERHPRRGQGSAAAPGVVSSRPASARGRHEPCLVGAQEAHLDDKRQCLEVEREVLEVKRREESARVALSEEDFPRLAPQLVGAAVCQGHKEILVQRVSVLRAGLKGFMRRSSLPEEEAEAINVPGPRALGRGSASSWMKACRTPSTRDQPARPSTRHPCRSTSHTCGSTP